ncbi:thioredoxin domain-containing protein [Schistocerca nitens]|uniref:thioredoxin domain-containing protein n=1 Tax=Schistocerca nitens TaxID=7011 RepID=UPI002118FA10|nr:thioredoxin domain-containing protein [Schistocerca nitens]
MCHFETAARMWVVKVSVFLLAVIEIGLSASTLESVNDDELSNLIRSEKYVVVVFTKKDCEPCDDLENELIALREDLVDTLNAWVVKATNSQLVKLYNPSKEPALVFFRHGVPLLYHGPLNDDSILQTFSENREPAVKELTDDTFEHLTQAASGATTGDWFVMFEGTDCAECGRLMARWEAVGAKLRGRVNVARVDVNSATARRFSVSRAPTFILFRHGRLYRYNIHKYDIDSFVLFASDWFKNVAAEPVPVPKSPFDDLVERIAIVFRDNPLYWQAGLGVSVIGTILVFLISCRRARSAKAAPTKKKK